MRPVDTAARLGGDEFAILLRDTESELHSIEIASRVMAARQGADRARPAATSRSPSSVGIAFSRPAHGLLAPTPTSCCATPTRPCTWPRSTARTTTSCSTPRSTPRAMARMELKAELQRALDAGEFTLRYQPIMDLERGDMAGMEALARWEHPERGHPRADRVRAAARGNRADRAGRPPHPARGLHVGGADAAGVPARAAAVDGRQRLGAPAAAPGVHRRGRRGARGDRRSSRRASRWS